MSGLSDAQPEGSANFQAKQLRTHALVRPFAVAWVSSRSLIVAMVLSVEAMIGEQVGAGRGSPGWLLLDEIPDILLIAKHFTAGRSRAVPRMLRDQLS